MLFITVDRDSHKVMNSGIPKLDRLLGGGHDTLALIVLSCFALLSEGGDDIGE